MSDLSWLQLIDLYDSQTKIYSVSLCLVPLLQALLVTLKNKCVSNDCRYCATSLYLNMITLNRTMLFRHYFIAYMRNGTWCSLLSKTQSSHIYFLIVYPNFIEADISSLFYTRMNRRIINFYRWRSHTSRVACVESYVRSYTLARSVCLLNPCFYRMLVYKLYLMASLHNLTPGLSSEQFVWSRDLSLHNTLSDLATKEITHLLSIEPQIEY